MAINFIEVSIANVVEFIKNKIHVDYGTIIATAKWVDEKTVVASIYEKANDDTTKFVQIELMCSNGPAVVVGDKISIALKGSKFEIVSTPRSKYATYKIMSSADFRIFKEKDTVKVIQSGTF